VYTSDVGLGQADTHPSELRALIERLPPAVRELYETRGPEALRMFWALYSQTVKLCETSGVTAPQPERFLAFFEGGAAFPEEATPTGIGLSNIVKRVVACMLGQYLAPLSAQLPAGAAEEAEKKIREFAGTFFRAVDGALSWIPATVTPAEVIPRLPRLLGLVFSSLLDRVVSSALDGDFAQAVCAALELTGIEAQRLQDAKLIAYDVTGTGPGEELDEYFGDVRGQLIPGVASVVAECVAEGITAAQACAALPVLAGAAIARAAVIRSSSVESHRRITAARARPCTVRRLRVRRYPRARRHTARRSCSSSSSLDGDAGGDDSGPPPPAASSHPPRSSRVGFISRWPRSACLASCPVDRSGSEEGRP
jgi:hypothetical protein